VGIDAGLASTSKSEALNVAETAGEFGRLNRMIVLFTDFGLHGPYTGQMKAVLLEMAPGVPIVDLFGARTPANVVALSRLPHGK
jgi:hypothetical protein